MRDIIKEMGEHVPESFFGHYIFLSTDMTVSSLDDGAAIQAILLFSLRNMRQSKKFG